MEWEIMDINMDLISSLVKLSLRTTRDIAQACEMSQPNMLTALAGKRSFPKDKLARLLLTLGIDSQLPSIGQVHYWRVGVDITLLQTAVAAFFPSGAEIAGIWRKGDKSPDHSNMTDKQMFVIYDERTLVVLQRTALGANLPLVKPIGPNTLSGLQWKGGRVGANNMVPVSTELHAALENGEPIDEQEMRQVIGCLPTIRWQDVLDYMQRINLTPSDALEVIQSWSATSKLTHPKWIAIDNVTNHSKP
jgi:hypothetical protein